VESSSQIATTNNTTPNVLQAGCPSCCRVKALKVKRHISPTFALLTDTFPLLGQLSGGMCLLEKFCLFYPILGIFSQATNVATFYPSSLEIKVD